jgi:hypothetical protein
MRSATVAQGILVVAVVITAAAVIARFEGLCLRDLADTPDAELQYLTRAGWTAAIILAIPLGGIAYLYLGRIR